jgi:uncharacterized protein (DUF849 family)
MPSFAQLGPSASRRVRDISLGRGYVGGGVGIRWDRILRVLMEPEERVPAEAVATAAKAAAELARLGITARQVRHGYNLATWDVPRASIADGQDIRVGLEDTTVLPDGSVAAGNRDLVAAAARLADES